MKTPTPYSDQHFKLLAKIKTVKDPALKKRLCIEDIDLYPRFKREWEQQAKEIVDSLKDSDKRTGKKRLLGYYSKEYARLSKMPNYPSFKALAILLEKEKDYASAISICKESIRAGQFTDDMKNRIIKLEAKRKTE